MKLKLKRMLSFFLAVSMLFGMVNTSVFADASLTDGVYFTKSILNTSGQPDRLKLEAYTTGVVTSAAENVPTDIVLVLDQSGSMDYALGNSTVLEVMRDAVETFVDEIATMNGNSGNYRVAIVGFASQSDYDENTEILTLTHEIDIEEESYELVLGELDISKTYYVLRRYYSTSYYATISYNRWRQGWYYEGYNQQAVDVTNTDVYELITKVVGTQTLQGVSYDTLMADDADYDFASALIDCTDDEISSTGTIGKAIAALDGNGATRTDLGLELAYDILSAAAQESGYDREQVVVLLTDGVPTTNTAFDNDVANAGVDFAKDLKDDGAHIFSMYLGSPGNDAVNFLQAVSSNYPDATSITNRGTQAASSYYSAHSDSAAIKNVFSQIVSSILSDSHLNESSIVADELSEYFRLPYMTDGEYDLDQIEVYTVDYLGGDDFEDEDNWASVEAPFDTAAVELSRDGKTIEVTGFNFAYHCVTAEAKTAVTRAQDYGRKLVIYIPIIPDETSNNFGGYLPTNEDAEILHNQTLVDSANSCYTDLTINYEVVPAERAFHVDGTHLENPVDFVFSYKDNMDSILSEMITEDPDGLSDLRIPDGKNNAGVDMVYRLYDIGIDDRNIAQDGDNSDDKLIASLEVSAGEKLDASNPSKWTWYDENGDEVDLNDLEATITIPANEYFEEKVYVLVCTLTNCDDETDSLSVYNFLDVSVTRGDLAHIVYGTIDDGGSVSVVDNYDANNIGDPENNDPDAPDVNDEGKGKINGGTYTEAVIEHHDSDTMVFTVKPGYEIKTILLLTSNAAPFDTRQYIYDADDPSVQNDAYPVNLTYEGGWEVYVDNVTSGVAFEIVTRPLVFTLDTTADEGAHVTDDTTFAYSKTDLLDVYFSAKTGYYLDYVVVNGTTYTAEDASDPDLADEYGLHITGTTTSWVEDSNGDWTPQTVITGGTIDLPKVKDYEVEVYTKKQIHQVTYHYYVQENASTYSDWDLPITEYVVYGDDLPIPTPTTGAETQINEDNYTLSEWYDTHDGIDFYGLTNLNTMTMAGADLDYHAFWAKNPNVKSSLTIQKNVTGAHTEDETFSFEAIFHEELVGSATITIPADSSDSVSTQMEIEMTDAEYDQFVAGNGAIYLYEVAGTATNYWKYDTSRYEIRWNSQVNEAMLWLNGEPVLTETDEISRIAYFTNEMIADPDLTVSEKTLVGNAESVPVGETLIWEITVENNGYADGMLTAEDITDEILYQAESGEYVSFEPAQHATIITVLPLLVKAQDSVTLTAIWTVPEIAAGKTIVNNAKIGNEPGGTSEETEVQNPDLTVTKTLVSAQTAQVGDTVVWEIKVQNTGNIALSGIALTDTLDNAFGTAKLYDDNTELADDYTFTLAVGADKTFTAKYTVLAEDAGNQINNTIVAENPQVRDEDTSTDPVTVKNQYTVTYQYQGSIPVSVDPVPASVKVTEGESYTIAGNPAAVAGYDFSGWVPEDQTLNVSNGAFTMPNKDVVLVGTFWTHADIDVVKHVMSINDTPYADGMFATVGDEIAWTITVTNTGDKAGHYELHDELVGVKVYRVIDGNIDSTPIQPYADFEISGNTTHTFIAKYTVTETDEGSIKNSVNINGTTNDQVEDPVPLFMPDVDKTVTRVGATAIQPGDTIPTAKINEVIEWAITVTNTGDKSGTVKLVDTLTDTYGNPISGAVIQEQGTNAVIANSADILVAANSTQVYLVTFEVKEFDQLLKNTVTLSDDNDSTEDPTDTSEEVPTETHAPAINITKSLSLGQKKQVKVGEIISWTITVQNIGNTKLTGLELTDDLTNTTGLAVLYFDEQPAPESFDLEVNEQKIFVAKYEVRAEDAGSEIYNTVVVKNDHVEDKDTTEDSVIVDDPKLNVTKKLTSDQTAKVGDTIVWEIKVQNTGNVALSNIKLTDTLTNAFGTAKLYDGNTELADDYRFTLAVAGEKTFTAKYTVLAEDAGNQINNTIVAENEQVRDEDTSTDPVTLKNQYTVTYLYHGSIPASVDPVPESVKVTEGESYTIAPNPSAVDGYDFSGWVPEDQTLTVSNGAFIMPGKDVVLVGTFWTHADIDVEKHVAYINDTTYADGMFATVGDEITWTITVKNTGDKTGHYELHDELAGVKVYRVIDGNIDSTPIQPYADFEISGNTTHTFIAKYTVTETDEGSIKNSVNINGTTTDQVEDPVPLFMLDVEKKVTRVGDQAINPGDTIPTAMLGETIEWTITVTNTGDKAGTVKLVDTLTDAEGNPISGAVIQEKDTNAVIANGADIAVAPNSTKVYLVTFEVKEADQVLKNTVTLDTDDTDPTDSSEDVPTEPSQPTISVTKHPARGQSKLVKVNDTIKWTIVVQNTGNVKLTGLKLTDTLKNATGLAVLYFGDQLAPESFDLEAGEKKVFTAQYEVRAEDAGSEIFNTVVAKNDLVDDDDTTDEPIIVENPKLNVTKKLTSDQTAKVGDTIVWEIKVQNNGNITFSNLKLTDTLDNAFGTAKLYDGNTELASNYTFTLAVDSEKTFTAKYTVLAEDAGKQINNAIVTENEQVRAEDTADTPVTIKNQYTVTYQYQGSIPESVDAVPESVKITEGESYTIASNPTAVDGYDFSGWVPNDHSLTVSNGSFIMPGKDVVLVGTFWTHADIDVEKHVTSINDTNYAEGMFATVGDEITWTITVTNTGDKTGHYELHDELVGVKVYCVIGGNIDPTPIQPYAEFEIAGNTTHTFVAKYTVTESDEGRIKNRVTINGTTTDQVEDPVPLFMPDVDKTVTRVGNQVVNPGDTIPTAMLGETIEWTITVTNTGDKAGTVKLVDTLTDAEGNPISGAVIQEKGTNTVFTNGAIITLDANSMKVYLVTFKVQDTDQILKNTVKLVTGDTYPSDSAEDVPTESSMPRISVTKTLVSAQTAKVDDTIVWEIKVQNTGNVALSNIKLTDTLTSAAGTAKLYDGESELSANYTFDLPINGVKTFMAKYIVLPEDAGKQINNTIIASNSTTSDEDIAKDSVDVEEQIPGILIEKSVDKTSVEVGDKLIYTLLVANAGEVKLTDIVVTDTFSGDINRIVIDDLTEGATYTGNGVFKINELDINTNVTIKYTYTTETEDVGTLTNIVVAVATPSNGDSDVTDEAPPVSVVVEEDDDFIVVPDPGLGGDDDDEVDPVPPVDPKPELDKSGDHLSYIIGYPDGTVQPTGTITRAEVATIFFRLLTDESRAYFWSQENNFSDVTANDWFNNAVSTMAAAAIVNGYPDGTFRPQAPVSRAEFAAIATRFTEEGRDGVSQKFFKQYFNDVNKEDWYATAVELAYELGWAQGYEGNYRPQDAMTRAEVMTMVNRIMEREVMMGDMLVDMIYWPDNTPEMWYYEAVQEATNSHAYERTNNKVPNLNFCYEVWQNLLENPDWAALERAWSDANSQN